MRIKASESSNFAPIKKGEKLGKVEYYLDENKLIGEANLISKIEVGSEEEPV